MYGNYGNPNQAQTYRDNLILQADPVELVRILYRTAVASVGGARAHLREGDVRARAREITKAVEIVNELTGSLDQAAGGELARNLVELYDYILRLLLDGNFRQVDPPLAEAETLLRTLLDGWEQCRPEAAAASAGERICVTC